MAVKIGSARIDERGRISGGQAGDQTGKEVSTQNWYLHTKGWRVFRAKDPPVRARIAEAMERACANPHIGYDQIQRNSLYRAAEGRDFDPARVKVDVETDCSALVRVCCAYAGVRLPDFNTVSEAAALLASGAFAELKGDRYQAQSKYLGRGDILVTRTKGHTAVVLSNGSGYEGSADDNNIPVVTVKDIQAALITLGYELPRYGADGEYGPETASAIQAFQRDHGMAETGEIDNALIGAIGLRQVRAVVTGESVFVRSAPMVDPRTVLGVVKQGRELVYQGVDKNGFHLVMYDGQNAWISGRFSEIK